MCLYQTWPQETMTKKTPLLSEEEDYTNQKKWRTPLWLIMLIIVILLTLGLGGTLSSVRRFRKSVEAGDILESPETARKVQSSNTVESMEAVVATDDARCSEIGASFLREGGHAVDASVATALCLGVVYPTSSGVGGGGFMVVRSADTSQTQAFDFRETAPLAASENMYENNLDAKYKGALSMGVPGEISGLHKAWSTYGRLPWKTLFDPAIRLAKDGFVVAPYLAGKISSNEDKIKNDPGLQQVFAPNGELLKAGDICYNRKLALTLEIVANEGPKAFYDGVIGEKLVKDVQDAGGILTMEDLRNYDVNVMDALAVDTMGHTILGMPPPSSGTLGLALVSNILESYGNSNSTKGPLGLHRFIEALKHMFAVRMDLGDPDFVDISKTVAEMLSPAFAKNIQEKILDNTTFPSIYYMPRWSQLQDHGTSHFCIVDDNRNAVSMTTTVNYAFGGGVLSRSTGIVLNNEMGDFSVPTEISSDKLPPSPSNFIRPNKRPLSSMTPLIILKDEQLAGVIGGAGGMDIIPAVAQVFFNYFVLGMDPSNAVQSPRVYHKGYAGKWMLTRFASSSAVATKSSSGGLFSWFTGGSASTLPPLDFPLKVIELPPSLPDNIEPGKTKITTLPNGLKIASETSSNPAASIGLYVNSGSIYETPASFGVTHLLERMAFKSTNNRSHLRVVREVEAIGGNVTASASREQMGYTYDALKTYVPQMVELLVDSVRNQAFLDWEVKEQIEKVKAEIGEYANNPEALLLEAVHSVGYSGPLANPLLASEGVLGRINNTVLEDFVAANYTAPRMVLAASGVEHEELLKYAEPLLSDLPGGAQAEEPKSVYVGGDYRVMADTGRTSFALAFELPGGWLKEKEAMALTVLQMLMGGGGSFSAGGPGKGMYSRLYLRVLNEYPEIQSFSAFSSIYNHTAVFGIQATTSSDFVSKAIDIAAKELIAVATNGEVNQVQLNRAKKSTKSAILMNLESRMVASEDIGRQILTYGERKPVEYFLKAIDEVTASDITSIAKKLLSSPLTMASHGDVINVPTYDSVSRKFQ